MYSSAWVSSVKLCRALLASWSFNPPKQPRATNCEAPHQSFCEGAETSLIAVPSSSDSARLNWVALLGSPCFALFPLPASGSSAFDLFPGCAIAGMALFGRMGFPSSAIAGSSASLDSMVRAPCFDAVLPSSFCRLLGRVWRGTTSKLLADFAAAMVRISLDRRRAAYQLCIVEAFGNCYVKAQTQTPLLSVCPMKAGDSTALLDANLADTNRFGQIQHGSVRTISANLVLADAPSIIAIMAASCCLMRSSFPLRPPNRPQGSLASSFSNWSSSTVPDAKVPSRLTFLTATSDSSVSDSLDASSETPYAPRGISGWMFCN